MGNSRINMVCDSYVSLEDAVLQNYIADKYSFPIVNVAIKDEKFDDFISDLRQKFSDIVVDVIDISTTSRFAYVENKDKFFMELVWDFKNKSYTINIYGATYGYSNDVWVIVKQYEPGGNGIFLEVDNYTMSDNGALNIRKDFRELSDIYDASEDYYPYLDTDVLFKKFALSSENILLLVGQPGVGKTKLVALYEKYMFKYPELFNVNKDLMSEESYFKIAYVKNEDILAKDSFWEDLQKNNYNLIFLDDADNCLLPRDSEVYTNEDANRKKFISQLLSFTDGITESNTKIIITTNRSVDNIDVAVLRRGRTFDILELQSLSPDEALVIWENADLSKEQFEDLFKDKHDIIPSELGAEISIRKKMGVDGSEVGEYLKRDGVSLIHSFRNRKRSIGL